MIRLRAIDYTDFHAVTAEIKRAFRLAYVFAAFAITVGVLIGLPSRSYITAILTAFFMWLTAALFLNCRVMFLQRAAAMSCKTCGASLTGMFNHLPRRRCSKYVTDTPDSYVYRPPQDD